MSCTPRLLTLRSCRLYFAVNGTLPTRRAQSPFGPIFWKIWPMKWCKGQLPKEKQVDRWVIGKYIYHYLSIIYSSEKNPSPFSGRDNSSPFFGAWGWESQWHHLKKTVLREAWLEYDTCILEWSLGRVEPADIRAKLRWVWWSMIFPCLEDHPRTGKRLGSPGSPPVPKPKKAMNGRAPTTRSWKGTYSHC